MWQGDDDLRNGVADHMGFIWFEKTLQNWTYNVCCYVKCHEQGGILKRPKGVRRSNLTENPTDHLNGHGGKLKTDRRLVIDQVL